MPAKITGGGQSVTLCPLSGVRKGVDGYMMADVIVVIILVLIIGSAVAYLVRAKRSGMKCVGCPAGGSCSGSRKVKKKKLAGTVIGKKTIQISGMSCSHCVMSVTDSLNRIDGVRAEVNLSKGNAVVSYDRDIDDNILKSAVEKAGFKVDSIHA